MTPSLHNQQTINALVLDLWLNSSDRKAFFENVKPDDIIQESFMEDVSADSIQLAICNVNGMAEGCRFDVDQFEYDGDFPFDAIKSAYASLWEMVEIGTCGEEDELVIIEPEVDGRDGDVFDWWSYLLSDPEVKSITFEETNSFDRESTIYTVIYFAGRESIKNIENGLIEYAKKEGFIKTYTISCAYMEETQETKGLTADDIENLGTNILDAPIPV